MDRETASLDFAVIGHQDSWKNIVSFVNCVRADAGPLPEEEVRSIFPFLPPRDIFRVQVRSISGSVINGVYIETFIDPEKLDESNARVNISKVLAAMRHAAKLGARVATLGGFCSIVLEGNIAAVGDNETKFTTGNTLTAALIAKGIEAAANQHNLDLGASNLLVVGATGDIGMAVVSYFGHKVRNLLLAARNGKRLYKLAVANQAERIPVKASTCYTELLPEADVIVFAASSSSLSLAGCKPGALICDAGYPKNVESQLHADDRHSLFYGGMGCVTAGYHSTPDYASSFYLHPYPNVIHGCILEAMVLSFEKNYSSYSWGKGNISVSGMEEIFNWSTRNGITLAPFFNGNGIWN